MMQDPFKYIEEFDPKELHKKIGQLIYSEDGDSDLQENGFMMKRLWFRTENLNLYLIWEEKIE